MPIKIIIADDDKLITESMKIILQMDDRFQVIGLAENGEEAVALCREHKVDVAMLDIRMPKLNGVQATKRIIDTTDTKVLILTTFDEDEYIKKAFKNGATGYLLKNNPPSEIINAIIAINGGNVVMQGAVLEKMTVQEASNTKKLDALTNREIDIVKAIAGGLTNREIASKLFISEGTVKNNVTSILGKLNLKHRTQIAIYYLTD